MSTIKGQTVSQLNIAAPSPIFIDEDDHNERPFTKSIAELPSFGKQKKASNSLLAQMIVKGLVPMNHKS